MSKDFKKFEKILFLHTLYFPAIGDALDFVKKTIIKFTNLCV